MKIFTIIILLSVIIFQAGGQDKLNERIKAEVERSLSTYHELYKHLHQNPELSLQEFETARRMEQELSTLGYEVTPGVGGNSLVGVYENGSGPVVMFRTDMDALPILEKTGLAYASKVTMTHETGALVPVMHACGHDMHMAVFLATANTMVKLKDSWKGTLVFIAQQAEEGSRGADVMISAGLFKRFPKPDYALAYHVSPTIPAGSIGYRAGAILASVSSVDIIFKGVGGHGAYPHKTIDPVVMSARAILDFQTIVSREINAIDPAVVTVGAIHGGTQYNIIPDEVKMQLTIRTYNSEVKNHILEALNRISKHVALSARMPEDKLPEVIELKDPTPPVVNDANLVSKAVVSFKNILGSDKVMEVTASMAGEDFGRYGLTEEKIPISLFWLGSVNVDKYSQAQIQGTELPPLHSPYFYPDPEPTLRTGAIGMTRVLMDLLKK